MSKHLEALEYWKRLPLFDAIPMSIAVIDKQRNIVDGNNMLQECFGSWNGQKCYNLYFSRSTPCSHCKGLKTFSDGMPRVFFEQSFDANGIPVCQTKHTFPIFDKDNKVVYVAEILSIIKDTGDVLLDYQRLFELIPCNITLLNQNMEIVKCNQHVKNMFGNIEGQHCYKAMHKNDKPCPDCLVKESFSDGKFHFGLHHRRNTKGEKIDLKVSTAPLTFLGDGPKLVLNMSDNITKQLELEKRLEIANSYVNILISNAMDGIIALDEKMNVTIVNRAAKAMIKLPPDVQLTKTMLDTMLPDNFIEEVLPKNDPYHLANVDILTLSGKSIPVRLIGIKLQSADGGIGVGLSIQDLSKIKKLEKEKMENERMAAVGHTVAGLAHSIKNMLYGLEGGIYTLKGGVKRENTQRIERGLEMVENNVDRLSQVVKAFLNYTRGAELKFASCSLSKLAIESINFYKSRVKESNITLISEIDNNMGEAMLDKDAISQGLLNLLGNAIEACIACEEERDYVVKFKSFIENNIITFVIEDNGCGIDEEVKSKIFTPFFTTKGMGGTGVGLALTRKIILLHGGNISFSTVPNEKTIFEIRIPLTLP